MVGFITKFLFATTVTAPTFLSLGLIGIIKDSKPYLSQWKELFTQLRCPSSMEWWGINISFAFTIICLLGVGLFLNKKSKKYEEGKTINVIQYSNMAQNGAEQVISSIIPWLTIFADNLDFMVLFVCIMLQCCFIAIASYNSNSYNLICSILGYRYYEVQTEENTYTLITSKCIRNKKEIKRFVEVTDYMGLIIKDR